MHGVHNNETYEQFIERHKPKKTTDDCYTPEDVYNAVVEYVDSLISLRGKQILRPFYPGGDYEHAEYPKNGIVIDNPPFSMFTKICKFYCERNIPFFLFGPGLTIGTIFRICTAVIIGTNIKNCIYIYVLEISISAVFIINKYAFSYFTRIDFKGV